LKRVSLWVVDLIIVGFLSWVVERNSHAVLL
jgi:hypothetical protein